MGRIKRKGRIKNVGSKYPTKSTDKYLLCKKCQIEEVKVSEDAVAVICWRCCQMMVEPPAALVKAKKDAENEKKPRKQRGWQFMKEYVDDEGNVYHKGKEQPKLKGTLPPTPKKEYKRKTARERIEEEEKKQAKLLKRFEKAKREKDKKNGIKRKKRGRKPNKK